MRHQGLPWFSRTVNSKIQTFLNNGFHFYEIYVDGFPLQLESFRTNQTKGSRDEGLLSPELCLLALTYHCRSKFYIPLLTSPSSTRKASPLPPWAVISYLFIRSSIINSFKFDSKGSLGLRTWITMEVFISRVGDHRFIFMKGPGTFLSYLTNGCPRHRWGTTL